MCPWPLGSTCGASAFCINCVPPGHVDVALADLLNPEGVPLGVYANLGHADANQDWQGSATLSPGEYAGRARKWVDAGFTLVGGCCGSTPAHIEQLAKQFKPSLFNDKQSL